MRKVAPSVVVLILTLHPAVVPAQSTNGSISGRVTCGWRILISDEIPQDSA
jgi:hypothetical protein